MGIQATKQQDRFVRHAVDFEQRPRGLTALDQARRVPGPSIPRQYLTTPGDASKQTQHPTRTGEFLCPGAVLTRDADRRVCHLAEGATAATFAGFAAQMLEDDKVLVNLSGVVLLRIPGATPADAGRPVYAVGADNFTLQPEGPHIGRLMFLQPDRPGVSAVAFHAAGESSPYDKAMANLGGRR